MCGGGRSGWVTSVEKRETGDGGKKGFGDENDVGVSAH